MTSEARPALGDGTRWTITVVDNDGSVHPLMQGSKVRYFVHGTAATNVAVRLNRLARKRRSFAHHLATAPSDRVGTPQETP